MAFPEGFWFGAGAPAEATGAIAPASDLARWAQEHGSVEPPGPALHPPGAVPHADRLVAAGVRHLRLTLPWAALEPAEGRVDDAAVEDLRVQLTGARDAGLAIWACLHDGSLPGWFAHDERGFADERSRRYYWARHVERVGEVVGDLVHGWIGSFEPSRWAYRGWVVGARPPGRHGDAEGFAEALEAVHVADVEAALRLRGSGRPVASAQWVVPLFPARPDPDSPPTAEAQAMTTVVDEALWGCWRRLLVEDVLQVPGRPPVDVPGAREAFDVLGLTYRHAAAVRGDGALLPYPQTLATGADGQVPWPEGLGLALHHVAEALPDRPLLVAGYGLRTDDEDRRAEHLRDGLAIAHDAVGGGIDLRGFWWDTPVDPPGGGPGPGLLDAEGAARPAADLLASIAAGASLPS
ncbi:MAG TPA: hypothetical protein VHK88_02620 [Aquihabitans sp.]|jgi:beta-glucosidase|nr:hypothetical protein [Aquihabitans sp.]